MSNLKEKEIAGRLERIADYITEHQQQMLRMYRKTMTAHDAPERQIVYTDNANSLFIRCDVYAALSKAYDTLCEIESETHTQIRKLNNETFDRLCELREKTLCEVFADKTQVELTAAEIAEINRFNDIHERLERLMDYITEQQRQATAFFLKTEYRSGAEFNDVIFVPFGNYRRLLKTHSFYASALNTVHDDIRSLKHALTDGAALLKP